MIHLFASEISIPIGFDNWLLNAIAVMSMAVLVAHFVKLMKGNPPMDQQVRHLEKRLTEKIDKEIDTLSDWVVASYVPKPELTAFIARMDDREVHANEFRAAFNTTLNQVFTLVRSIEGKLNFMEGRASKTQRITIEQPR